MDEVVVDIAPPPATVAVVDVRMDRVEAMAVEEEAVVAPVEEEKVVAIVKAAAATINCQRLTLCFVAGCTGIKPNKLGSFDAIDSYKEFLSLNHIP